MDKPPITEWQAMDMILQLLVDKPGEQIDDRIAMQELFPDLHLEYVEGFFRKLKSIETTHPVFKEYNFGNGGITNTVYTKDFLETGGFVRVAEDYEKKKAQQEFASKLELEKLILDTNESRDKMSGRIKAADDRSRGSLWIAIIAIVLTALDIVLRLIKKG